MNHPIIEITELEFGYDKFPFLNIDKFEISKREFIGVFGPNGGGKTTFLKLLMGFLIPRKGIVTIFGTSPKAARSSIGYVPQAIQYDKKFPISVLELVLMGCISKTSLIGTFSSKIKEKAKAALIKVGLEKQLNQAFGTLSGGQVQRALIARAIVDDPSLLLLDEPTTNIDPHAELEILDLLMELKKSMTIIMVTHDLQTILNKTERLLCIHRTLTSYTPQNVCEHFAFGLYHSPLKILPPLPS